MKSATGLKVTLLGSEWSSSMGGLSTINRQLAIQLAKHSEVDVTLLVPQSACSEDERRNASSHNVSIQEARKRIGFSDPLDWLDFPPKDLVIDFVLGHGAKLGKQAQVIRDSHNCKWIQVVHTAPEELAMHKNYPKAISKGEEKNLTEVELCKLADAVLAVGPKLADAFSTQLRSCKSQEDILQLTPGTFREFYDVKQAKKESNKFKVLTFGRGDPEDFSLKGHDISARAISELKDRSYSLIFVGAPDGKQDEVAANLLKSGIDKSQLTVRKFVQSKGRLKELFCKVDLCIMPSRTEGFGLTALEALSAGLSILVSGNSGLGEALCTVPSGKSFVVESEDPGEWAKAIAGIRQMESSVRLQSIQQLRISYEEKFSWEKQCDNLVEKMWDIVRDSKRQDTRFKTQLVEVDSLLTLRSLDQIIQKLQQMQLDASKVKSRTDLSLWLRNIASVRGFRISDNEGLGNCMFYALSEQLEIVMGIKIPSGELRQILVQYLRSNPKLPDGTDLFHFVHGHQTWTEYLECMEQDGVWGDHVILYAAANYFQTCIRVVSSLSLSNDVIITPHCPFDESKPFVLGHIHEVHYVSLQPVQVPPEILARGPLAQQAYYHALDEGKICDRRVPLMLVGQDRSGKTSLKKSLKGIYFNSEEESTVGIDFDPNPFKVTTEMWMTGKKNEEGDVDEEAISFEQNAARLAADTLRTTETVNEISRRHNLGEGEDYDIDDTDDLVLGATSTDSSSGLVRIEQTEDPLSTESSFNETRSPVGQVPDPKKLEPEDDLPNPTPEQASDFEEIATRIESLLKEKKKGKEVEADDVYSILWDFAGESVYYVTHPLFLTARAIYFLVYNLNWNPNAKANRLMKQGVYAESQDSFNLKTNLDYLDFWMNSLASLAAYSEDKDMDTQFEVLPKRLPMVFLVCTHADEPYEGRDARKLAAEVYGTLKERPYGTHLFGMYCVDNTKSGRESECQEVGRLRKDVLAAAKKLPHIKEVIPVKWLKYEKTLQCWKKGGYNFISLETAKRIANQECDISAENDFKTLLNFLHDLRILIHFDDTAELNDLVVLDSQWLIDVFKKVITVKPYHWEEEPFLGLWRKLEREGILEEKLLEHVWEPQLIGGRENSEKLIALMERFSLLCSWPSHGVSGNRQFLVPSMLKSQAPEGVMKLVSSAQIPSLVVKFESGQVPAGLFPRLVLQFFQWGKESFWSSKRLKLFHGFSRFYTSQDAGCSVILLCHSSYIEVVYHQGNANDESVNALQSPLSQKSMSKLYNENDLSCVRVVCRQLGLILECMRNQFRWLNSMRYKMGIICPICREQSAVEYCERHQSLNCKQEECLHFWSESELCASKGDAFCMESVSALNNRFNLERWAPWFSSQDNWVGRSNHCDELLFLEKGKGATTLSVPCEIVDTLLAQSNDCKDFVRQLEDKLNLNDAVLRDPDPNTRVLIRTLARKANNASRSDLVEELRKIVPAGTTAPMLPESLLVRGIPFSQLKKLTITLSGGDEWKIFAEQLGLTPEEIRFLDHRTLNPADAALGYIAQKYQITVGDLYHLLTECGLPVVADLL